MPFVLVDEGGRHLRLDLRAGLVEERAEVEAAELDVAEVVAQATDIVRRAAGEEGRQEAFVAERAGGDLQESGPVSLPWQPLRCSGRT